MDKYFFDTKQDLKQCIKNLNIKVFTSLKEARDFAAMVGGEVVELVVH